VQLSTIYPRLRTLVLYLLTYEAISRTGNTDTCLNGRILRKMNVEKQRYEIHFHDMFMILLFAWYNVSSSTVENICNVKISDLLSDSSVCFAGESSNRADIGGAGRERSQLIICALTIISRRFHIDSEVHNRELIRFTVEMARFKLN